LEEEAISEIGGDKRFFPQIARKTDGLKNNYPTIRLDGGAGKGQKPLPSSITYSPPRREKKGTPLHTVKMSTKEGVSSPRQAWKILQGGALM